MLYILLELLFCIIDTLFLHLFVSMFLQPKVIHTLTTKIVSISLISFSTYILSQFHSYSSLITILNVFIIFLYCLFIFDGRYENRILFGMIFYIFIGLINALIYTLSAYLLKNDFYILIKHNSATRIINSFIIKLIIFICIIFMKRFRKDPANELPKQYWLSFLGLFSLSLISIAIIFELALRYHDTHSYTLLIILTFILFVLNVAIYILFQKSVSFFAEKAKLDNFLTHQHLLEQHVFEVEKNHQEIRKIRHDMMNHYTIIDHYIHANKLKECSDYIAQLKSTLNQVPIYYKTGNDIADIIINQKIYSLKDEAIDFNIQTYIPSHSSLLATDLCVILSNLLDNAIEAVLELPPTNRQITVVIHPHESKLLLDFSNPVKESPIKNGNLQKRLKKNPNEHGYGFLNIAYVVNKYNGYMHYHCQDNIFNVSILLDYI